jgi:hypothetical protein
VLVTEGTEILGGEIQDARTFGSISRSDQDIGADYIEVIYISSGSTNTGDFNGLVYYFEHQSPRIVNAWLDAASDFTEAEARVTFDEHTVWVDLAGVAIRIGDQFVVRLELEKSTPGG